MKRYEVTITSNAVVKHIYHVTAKTPAQALALARGGDVECHSEEVYGEQETDAAISLVKKGAS